LNLAVVVSCEHATRFVPPALRSLFVGADDVLNSHAGWDPGARELAQSIATAFVAPLVEAKVSRLVIEANRTLGHPQLFSRFTRRLPAADKQALIEAYTRPHQHAVRDLVARALDAVPTRPIVHLSVHSFTPIWKGVERDVDVGWLYDAQRPLELDLAKGLQRSLQSADASLRVRRNRPYSGGADGLTTWLRTQFDAQDYVGLELEVSQAFPGSPRWPHLMRRLVQTLTNHLTHP
jgi:predicted N-formylglutamate amidohydrolase